MHDHGFTTHKFYLNDVERAARRGTLRREFPRRKTDVSVLLPVALSVIGLAALLSAIA